MGKLNFFLFFLACATCVSAQTTQSNANSLRTYPNTHTVVPFRYTDEGVKTPIEWGLDLAWNDEPNLRTGILFAGKDIVDIVRLSFQPTTSVENGQFSSSQKSDLNKRINNVKKWCKSDITYNINCDHPSLAPWYNDDSQTSDQRAQRWAKLIDMTADYYKSNGLTNLVSISPLNEPDYEWHHLPTFSHRKADFKAICKVFKEDEAYKEKYADVRMCGGNTLNNDQAYNWWNYMKPYIDEGNTHQLAGSFNNYASFFETVRKENNHATNDELHNVMEAIVGAQYGMQTGIWWGTAEYTRSQFMKATYQGNPGDRLGYAENRTNWTAASVYRHADGSVQGFAGSSERQAIQTTFRFVGLDRPVWYNGQRGREFPVTIVGPTVAGYQNGQTNGETLVDIQSGEDIMPYIEEGPYKILNVNSGKILGFSAAPSGWTQVTQQNNSTDKFKQWNLKPTAKSGDYNYYTLVLVSNQMMKLDIKDWNYNAGAQVGTYPNNSPGTNEQWYLQYAGNGAFYIRSRYSAKCLEVKDGKTTASAEVVMAEFNGEPKQQWRFIDVKGIPNMKAPAAPASLTVTAQSASVLLEWDAVTENDMKSYTILRSDDGTEFYTLANEIVGTSFIDNEAEGGQTYTYKVYAEDKWYNRSEAVAAEPVLVPSEKALVMNLPFENDLFDVTENANHCTISADTTFTTYKDKLSLTFDGTEDFVQLPYTVANSDEITISTWIYYRGGNQWQRIFDFGNDTEHYMFLTPSCGNGMRFAIKNGGSEEQLTTSSLSTTKWNHIALTMGADGVKLYINGELKKETTSITLRPSDIKPVMNYIGRSQFSTDPFLKGYVKDFRIYNYALSTDEIAEVYNPTTGIMDVDTDANTNNNDNNRFDLSGRRTDRKSTGIVIKNNKKFLQK